MKNFRKFNRKTNYMRKNKNNLSNNMRINKKIIKKNMKNYNSK